MSMRAGSRKRLDKRKVYGVAGIVLTILLALFCWHSLNLYRQKKAVEAQLLAEPYVTAADGRDGIIQYKGAMYERNPSVKAILCIGVDSAGVMEKRVTGAGGQADGIFLVAHDVARENVRVLMIPRDTMTPITLTDLSGNILGKDVQHITLAYGYGDGREQSCQWLAEAVSELLSGLSIDGYLATNTSLISTLNDLVGGVTVRIDVEGMERSDPELVKGATVKLNGKQAETFTRYRDSEIDYSAITRMSQQRQYIEGYFATVKQNAAKDSQLIPSIMNVIETDMITDMSKDQYMEMGLSILNSEQTLTGADIWMLPGTSVTTDIFDEFHHDPEGTLEMVLDLFYRQR